MDGKIVKPGRTVGQFIRDVTLPVVQPILQQDDIVARPEENGREGPVVFPLPRHVETAMDIDHDGILPDRLFCIINVQHLSGFTILNVSDADPLVTRIRIEQRRRCLHIRRKDHFQHGLGNLDPAASRQQE